MCPGCVGQSIANNCRAIEQIGAPPELAAYVASRWRVLSFEKIIGSHSSTVTSMFFFPDYARIHCEAAFGVYIEHSNGVPDTSQEALHAYLDAYQERLELYQTEFHDPPPSSCWPHPDRRIGERLALYKNPYRLHLETTNHCNLRCQHCYPESSSAEPHHPLQKIDRVLDEAARLGVSKITLTGGEVLTRPDWKGIFEKSLDVCDNLYFITNGLLLTEKKLEWLARQRTTRSLRKWRKSIFRRTPDQDRRVKRLERDVFFQQGGHQWRRAQAADRRHFPETVFCDASSLPIR